MFYFYVCVLLCQIQPAVENVVKRGLVTASVKATDVVREHQSYCDIEREMKQFQGDTLAYVTPVCPFY